MWCDGPVSVNTAKRLTTSRYVRVPCPCRDMARDLDHDLPEGKSSESPDFQLQRTSPGSVSLIIIAFWLYGLTISQVNMSRWSLCDRVVKRGPCFQSGFVLRARDVMALLIVVYEIRPSKG